MTRERTARIRFICRDAVLVYVCPIYKHVFIVRQAVLQKEVDYLLEVGANGDNGYVGPAMVSESRQRLAALGMEPEKVIYEIGSTSGAPANDPSAPLLRGSGIILTIRYPHGRILEIDRLIGMSPPSSETLMGATGMKMSEYVP
ncbi:hypothetical protein AB6A23_22900 [Paenibacillus tarimensis]